MRPELWKHLCKTCKQIYPQCECGEILYSGNVNGNLKGEEADIVLQCEGYTPANPPVPSGDTSDSMKEIQKWKSICKTLLSACEMMMSNENGPYTYIQQKMLSAIDLAKKEGL